MTNNQRIEAASSAISALAEDKHPDGEVLFNGWIDPARLAKAALNAADQAPADVQSARTAFNERMKEIGGCSNHSCEIDPPKGMGTNGPCSCLENRMNRNRVIHAYKTFMKNIDNDRAKDKATIAKLRDCLICIEAHFDGYEELPPWGEELQKVVKQTLKETE